MRVIQLLGLILKYYQSKSKVLWYLKVVGILRDILFNVRTEIVVQIRQYQWQLHTHGYQMYFSRYFSLCLQLSVTSHFRFKILSTLGARKINSFSLRQSGQVASKLPHTPAFFRIFHLIKGVRLSLFNSQKKVDSEVELWYCSFEKDCV